MVASRMTRILADKKQKIRAICVIRVKKIYGTHAF